jgi:2-dehydro-3-deoxygluconokinase
VSNLKPGDIDWDAIFEKTRWFHCGGIFAALSRSAADVVAEAMAAARRHGTVISYDLNYRPSLWNGLGGRQMAQEVNQRLVSAVDVIFGNEEDFTAALGFDVEGVDRQLTNLDPERFAEMILQVTSSYPNLSVVATTLRTVRTATSNDWGAICWADGEIVRATDRPGLEVFDRVGGGDSFASGLIYGLLSGCDARTATEYGAAHGALAMTTPGDTSMARADEVIALASGASARIRR